MGHFVSWIYNINYNDRRTNRYSKTINTSMKIEIDFDMGYETNNPWIEAIRGFVARQFKMIRLKRYESV